MAGRIAILGCGYVGSAVALSAKSAGYEVIGLTRNADTAEKLSTAGVTTIVANIADTSWQSKVAGHFDLVLVAVSADGSSESAYREAYVGNQEIIKAWLSRNSAQCYCYTGSTGVYPDCGGLRVVETDADPAASPNSAILLEAEALVSSMQEMCELAVTLRLGGIYGSGRHFLLDGIRNSGGVIPGRGDYLLNLIYRDDIASAILRLLDHSIPSLSGVYNLTDNNPSTKEVVCSWLGEQTGIAVRFDPTLQTARSRRRMTAAGTPPNRNVNSSRFQDVFDWKPAFPTFRAGFEAILRNPDKSP